MFVNAEQSEILAITNEKLCGNKIGANCPFEVTHFRADRTEKLNLSVRMRYFLAQCCPMRGMGGTLSFLTYGRGAQLFEAKGQIECYHIACGPDRQIRTFYK